MCNRLSAVPLRCIWMPFNLVCFIIVICFAFHSPLSLSIWFLCRLCKLLKRHKQLFCILLWDGILWLLQLPSPFSSFTRSGKGLTRASCSASYCTFYQFIWRVLQHSPNSHGTRGERTNKTNTKRCPNAPAKGFEAASGHFGNRFHCAKWNPPMSF